jgi:hypothetical protein
LTAQRRIDLQSSVGIKRLEFTGEPDGINVQAARIYFKQIKNCFPFLKIEDNES